MSTLALIDRQLPITVYATTSRMTREHVLRELAFEMVMPELLHVDEQIDEAQPLVIRETGEFLDWLRCTPGGRSLEAGLQCMSVSPDGIPLLTSWLSVRDFGRLVIEARGTRFSMRLHQALAEWGALGMDKVYFEGFKVLPANAAANRQGLPC